MSHVILGHFGLVASSSSLWWDGITSGENWEIGGWLNPAWQQQRNSWDLSFFSQTLSYQFFRFGSLSSSLKPDTKFLLKPGGKGLGFLKATWSRSCMKNH